MYFLQRSCLNRYHLMVLSGVFFVIYLLIFKKSPYSKSESKQIEIVKKCYEMKNTNESVKLLDDIMISKSKPTIDNTIFFHDTSCKNGTVSFTPRQACAIESAAKWNPKRDIFVLFAAHVGFTSNREAISPIMKALSSYPNIQYRTVDWYNYAVGTPVEEWVKEDRMLMTEHFMGHSSDFIRLLSLYHFGGFHLDLDFIVQKSFDGLPPNFVGAEERGHVLQNSVLGFESSDIGHVIVNLTLRHFMDHYNPKIWYANGPYVIIDMAKKICNTNDVTNVKPEYCWGLKIFDPPFFFPLHHRQWKAFFKTDPTVVKQLLEQIKDAYAIHFYNKATYKTKISKTGSTNLSIFRILAEKNCPKVWKSTGDEEF